MSTAAFAPPADSLQVLIVAADTSLWDECHAALRGVDRRMVLHTAHAPAEALAVARDRRPDIVILGIDAAFGDLEGLCRDLHALVPDMLMAGAYHPGRSGSGDTDSATHIIHLLRARVLDFVRRPVSPSELRDVIERLLAARPSTAAATGRIVSFISNKGGVGKSTMSVNVACALAQRYPDQVLLVDASLQLGICALMLDLQPGATLLDAARERDRLDEALLRGLAAPHESGVRLLSAPADAIEAAEVGDEAIAHLLNLARRAFRFVVVDTFPMLDSVVMSALDLSDLIFVVLQGTAPSIAGCARLLPVLDGLGFPVSRQRVILNRNHKRFLGDLGDADIEGRLGRPIDVAVPYDKRVLVSMNTGVPWAWRAPRWNGFGRAVTAIANAIDQAGVGEGVVATAAVDALRARFEPERRSGTDRRVRDVGRSAGDRRSGRDRRTLDGELLIERVTP